MAPVVGALLAEAKARAEAARAGAEEDARAERARARTEAEQLLAEARADGAEAAGQLADAQLVAARREAREEVLVARRLAYESLRQAAVAALVGQGSTPEGRRLGEWLAARVRDQLGPSAAGRRGAPGTLVAVAESESGNRRASLGPSDLVDHVLASLSAEVERLWA